jgi:hypothetical protein
MPLTQDIFTNPLFYLIAAGLVTASFIIWKSNHFKNQKLIDPMGYSFAILLLLLFFHKAPSVAVFIISVSKKTRFFLRPGH